MIKQALACRSGRWLVAPVLLTLAAPSCVAHRWVGQSDPLVPVMSTVPVGDVVRVGTTGGPVDLRVAGVDSTFIRGRFLGGSGLVGVELVEVRRITEVGPGPLGGGRDRRSVDLAGVRRDPAVLAGRSFEFRTGSGMVTLHDVQSTSDGWMTGLAAGQGSGAVRVRVDLRTTTGVAVRKVHAGRTIAHNLLWVGALAGFVAYCAGIADDKCGFGFSLYP